MTDSPRTPGDPPDVSFRRDEHQVRVGLERRIEGMGLTMTDEERDERLLRMEQMLSLLVERQRIKDFYEIDEFAKLVDKAPFTVREWARLGRIHAEKRKSGRGPSTAWVVSHQEWLRYQREGLLSEKRA
jgi:hypothetical protein